MTTDAANIASINDAFALAAQNDALVAELEQAHRDRAALVHEDNAIKSKLHLTITELRALLAEPRDAIELLLDADMTTEEGQSSEKVSHAWCTLIEWLDKTKPHGSEA